MPALKSLIQAKDGELFLNQLREDGVTFDLYASNYAMKIILDDGQIFNFNRHEQSRQCFAAYSKIKSELGGLEIPRIKAEDVEYFRHDFKKPIYIDSVVNFDLKSAYANILLMEKMISPKTYKYLCGLSKPDRLSAVGMLASKKLLYHYKKGEVSGIPTEERSALAPFFFFAVQKTSEIMNTLRAIAGKGNYYFTWVDGIYLAPDPRSIRECRQYLREIKFPFSEDLLTEFDVSFLPYSIKLSFNKDGKPKRFDLPIPDNMIMRTFKNFVLNNSPSIKTKSI